MDTKIQVKLLKTKKLSVKDLRKNLGMTQQEFADYFGVRRETVSRWETGRDEPDFLQNAIKLYKLLKSINRTPDDLAPLTHDDD